MLITGYFQASQGRRASVEDSQQAEVQEEVKEEEEAEVAVASEQEEIETNQEEAEVVVASEQEDIETNQDLEEKRWINQTEQRLTEACCRSDWNVYENFLLTREIKLI